MNNIEIIEIINAMITLEKKEMDKEKDAVVKAFLRGNLSAYKNVLTLLTSY